MIPFKSIRVKSVYELNWAKLDQMKSIGPIGANQEKLGQKGQNRAKAGKIGPNGVIRDQTGPNVVKH